MTDPPIQGTGGNHPTLLSLKIHYPANPSFCPATQAPPACPLPPANAETIRSKDPLLNQYEKFIRGPWRPLTFLRKGLTFLYFFFQKPGQ